VVRHCVDVDEQMHVLVEVTSVRHVVVQDVVDVEVQVVLVVR
jgi:hypothetical protein